MWGQFAGADMVKFQIHAFEDEQFKRDKSRYDWIQFNENLTPVTTFWKPLAEYVKSLGMPFITTPMSYVAARAVNDLVDVWKVGSADLTDFQLLKYIAKTGKPTIISTGMSTASEVKAAVNFLQHGEVLRFTDVDFAILHCVSIYPCPPDKINLATIEWLKQFDKPVGFSDHTTLTETPAVAVRRYGARIIEKHFTLDPNGYGPDHKFALTTKRFTEMVEKIRVAELDIYGHGDYEKIIYPSEQEGWKTWRR